MLLRPVKFLLIFQFIRENVVSTEDATIMSDNDVQKLSQPLSREDLNQDISSSKLVQSNDGDTEGSKEKLNQDMSSSEVQSNDVNNEETNTKTEAQTDTEPINSGEESDSPKEKSEEQDNDDRTKTIKSSGLDELGFDLTPEEMEKFKVWKNGVIPYYIDVVSFSDKVVRETIRQFLQSVNGVTSVNFVELPSPPTDEDTRWVMFLNRRGLLECADHSVKDFTNKGVQKVVLGYNCMATRGELAEAVMSILGIPAQHNAPNRDEYIIVKTENILPDKTDMFEKLSDTDWLFHDLDYDFLSVSHYDYNKYSANGHTTIEPKDPNIKIFPRLACSTFDIVKIQMLYNFIAKKRKFETSDCQKLFLPGNKPSKLREPVKKPRPKPCKYLGNCGAEENSRSSELVDTSGGDTIKRENQNEREKDGVALKKMEGYSIDVLSYLSDYQTDDGKTKKKKAKKLTSHVNSATLNKHKDDDHRKLKFGKPGRGIG